MLRREDRRELAVLGLLLLGWGLCVAPLLHSLTHAHGHAHTHGAPSKQSHGAGSTEHLLAFATTTRVTLEPHNLLQRLELAQFVAPTNPTVAQRRTCEQPQGP